MRLRIGAGERWAILAAASYTAVNVTLRAAAARNIDPFLGSTLRLVPVFLLAWGVVLVTGRREVRPRDPAFLGWPFVLGLILGGFISFLVGNVFIFQALADGGLGITVNAVQGGAVLGGIALAFAFLGETPRREQVAGAGLLALGLGGIAIAQLGTPGERWYLGLVFALLAGASYAATNVLTRRVQRARPVLFVTLAATSLGGLAPLAVVVLARAGWSPAHVLDGLAPETLGAVLLAGCANAFALVGLTQAMKFSDVATTNTISSSQVALSFVASVLLFGETGSALMVLGVLVVVAGIVVAQVDRSRRLPAPVAAPNAGGISRS